MTLSIDTLTAYIAVNDEGEGVTAFLRGGTWTPLVAADEASINRLRPLAQRIATESGRRIVVARFSVREDLEIIEP